MVILPATNGANTITAGRFSKHQRATGRTGIIKLWFFVHICIIAHATKLRAAAERTIHRQQRTGTWDCQLYDAAAVRCGGWFGLSVAAQTFPAPFQHRRQFFASASVDRFRRPQVPKKRASEAISRADVANTDLRHSPAPAVAGHWGQPQLRLDERRTQSCPRLRPRKLLGGLQESRRAALARLVGPSPQDAKDANPCLC